MTNEELYHHGILGQKWGVRRYQNPDGSLTPEGRKRYGSGEARNRVMTAVSNTKSNVSNKIHSISPETKKKIAIGAGATLAVVGIGAYVATHPESITKAAQFVSNKAFDIKYAMPRKATNATYQIKGKAIEKGKNFITQSLKEAKTEATKTVARAAGTAVLAKAADAYTKNIEKNESINPYAKAAYKSVYDDSTESLKKHFYLADRSTSSNYKGPSGSEIKKLVGEPAAGKNPIDKQTKEWADFIGSVPKDKKGSIKGLASQGYSYEQLRKIVNS